MPEATITLRTYFYSGGWEALLQKALQKSGVELVGKKNQTNETVDITVRYERPEQLYQLGAKYTREAGKEKDRREFEVMKQGGAVQITIPAASADRFRAYFEKMSYIELVDLKRNNDYYYTASIKFSSSSQLFLLGAQHGRDVALDDFSNMVYSLKWSREQYLKQLQEKID